MMADASLFDELPIDPGPSRAPAVEEPVRPPIVIVINGEPVAKGRARTFIRNGFVQHYTPKETQEYEQRIRQSARQAIGDAEPIDGQPIGVTVRVYVSIPSSWSGKKKAAALRGEVTPTGRPDGDNFLKIACDGMNGIVFRDDSLAIDMFISKRYSDKPRMEIEVYA